MYVKNNFPPAQLLIGQHATALKAVERLLQAMLCNNNSCNTCISCMQIREKQHHAIMWLYPEKNYTIEQLDDLFATLAFQLEPEQMFFFIIQKADFLTTACANKLLKPMEEPPAGYHFILLAEHAEQILPTIKSRCIMHTLTAQQSDNNPHPFVELFTKKYVASNEFTKILDATNSNERETLELLDHIIGYWLNAYRENPHKNLFPLITALQKAQLQPPMPGSSSMFWKNLYLQTREHYR